LRDTLARLLAEFGTQTGLGVLDLDESNYCGLTFDGKIDVGVLLDNSGHNVRLFSTLGDLRFEERTEAYRRLLLANSFWQQTGGGTLCLDDAIEPNEAGTVLLIKELPLAGLELAPFRETLREFVDAVEFWQARLATSPDQWTMAEPEAEEQAFVRV
jgi:hypothetical protein